MVLTQDMDRNLNIVLQCHWTKNKIRFIQKSNLCNDFENKIYIQLKYILIVIKCYGNYTCKKHVNFINSLLRYLNRPSSIYLI